MALPDAGWWDTQGFPTETTDIYQGASPGIIGGGIGDNVTRDSLMQSKLAAYRNAAGGAGVRVDAGDANVLSSRDFQGWDPTQPFPVPQAQGADSGRNYYAGIQSIAPYGQTFSAPTADEARQTPGYQFTMDEALRALDMRKAGQGRLRAGVGRDYANLATGLAEKNYGDTFNRALSAFGTNLGAYYQGENARFGSQMQLGDAGFRQNDANRGYGLQQGQLALQRDQFGNVKDQQFFDNLFRLQELGDPTREAATRGGFSAAEQEYNAQRANAQAAGTVGSANAWSNALNQSVPLTQMYLMDRYMNGSGTN